MQFYRTVAVERIFLLRSQLNPFLLYRYSQTHFNSYRRSRARFNFTVAVERISLYRLSRNISWLISAAVQQPKYFSRIVATETL